MPAVVEVGLGNFVGAVEAEVVWESSVVVEASSLDEEVSCVSENCCLGKVLDS